MNKTKIDWCSASLNPVVGCTYGCPFCYAKKMNDRFQWIEDFSKPEFFPDRLKSLYSKKPQVIFMDSMSDIADWRPEWIEQVFDAMADNPQHKYLFLTKRPSIFTKPITLSKNVMFGASITSLENRAYDNASSMVLVPYGQRFLSIEPLLGSVGAVVRSYPTNWVIIGAETGNRKEKVIPKREWVQDIVDQCRVSNVPVFLKSSLADIWGEPLIQEFPW
jgi:protein gp37